MESVEAVPDPDEVSSVGEALQRFFLLHFFLFGQTWEVLEADRASPLNSIVVLWKDLSHIVVQLIEDACLVFAFTAVERKLFGPVEKSLFRLGLEIPILLYLLGVEFVDDFVILAFV